MSYYFYITHKELFCKSCDVYHHSDNPNIIIGSDESDNSAFRLITHHKIPDLEAWKAAWEIPGTLIVDSAGVQFSPIDMLTIITFRTRPPGNIPRLLSGEISGNHGLIHIVTGVGLSSYNDVRIRCISNEDAYDLFKVI